MGLINAGIFATDGNYVDAIIGGGLVAGTLIAIGVGLPVVAAGIGAASLAYGVVHIALAIASERE